MLTVKVVEHPPRRMTLEETSSLMAWASKRDVTHPYVATQCTEERRQQLLTIRLYGMFYRLRMGVIIQ